MFTVSASLIMSDCKEAYIGLSLTALALVISFSLNVLFYSIIYRRRKAKDAEQYQCDYDEEERSHNCFRFEEEVQQQDNPIYGNICTNGGESDELVNEMCYEQMTGPRPTRNQKTPDVSYASLDLRVARKHKKKRKYDAKSQAHQTQHAQSHAVSQGSLEVVDPELEAALPSRNNSVMVSRHSIYLNSQQIVQEAQELEREREWEREREKAQEVENVEGKKEEW